MTLTRINGVSLDTRQDMVVRHYRTRGEFEPLSMRAWRAVMKPGKIAVDVGSYTGIYAIAAAQEGSEAWAVEPNSHACRRLQENALANGVSVRMVCAAASDHSGTCSLHVKSALSSANTLHDRYTTAQVVDTVRLDELLAGQSVCAIKVDVEGWEIPALDGCVETLRRCMPLIITEANTGSARHEQRDWFLSHGYGEPQTADDRNLIWRPYG